jgi:hypothetical protein
MKTIPVIIIGAILVLVFDTAASVLSASTGLEYSWFAIGSFVIYAVVGYIASGESLLRGVLASAAVGFVEATAGWWISWQVGPGAVEGETIDAATLAAAIVFVTVIAGLIGLIAGLAGRALTRR